MKLETNYVPLVRLCTVKEKFLPYGKEGISKPEKVVKMVRYLLDDADRECMLVIPIDSAAHPVGVEIVAIGAVNQVGAKPREIFKHAILCNASGIILVHNHPSGNTEPSREDLRFTDYMREVGEMLGVPVWDHIIVGENGEYQSLAESDEWQEWRMPKRTA